MPINSELPDKTFPMKFKWGLIPDFKIKEALSAIDVELMDCPTREQVMSYICRYSLATWEDEPHSNYSTDQQRETLEMLFKRQLLPSAMETINFTFMISNIDLIDVTHLIRHRTMSFSAHCTGDRDQRDDTCLIKPSIANSDFEDRYLDLMELTMQLYADMVDSEEVSILDARTVLPRSFANHYYARVSLKDIIPFFQQRLDRQIQPESDNIVALRMLVEVARVFPEIKHCVDLDRPDEWFVKTAQMEHSSNLYQPEPRNDIFEWKPQWFVYNKTREQMSGGYVFRRIWEELVEEYKDLIK